MLLEAEQLAAMFPATLGIGSGRTKIGGLCTFTRVFGGQGSPNRMIFILILRSNSFLDGGESNPGPSCWLSVGHLSVILIYITVIKWPFKPQFESLRRAQAATSKLSAFA